MLILTQLGDERAGQLEILAKANCSIVVVVFSSVLVGNPLRCRFLYFCRGTADGWLSHGRQKVISDVNVPDKLQSGIS